ncbi:MAG: lytic murein transglycosylase [Candidatus Sungbacteria bacterium]|nr:lytic murein transglycosylase [Candidatus Sungbacteria bacterium]
MGKKSSLPFLEYRKRISAFLFCLFLLAACLPANAAPTPAQRAEIEQQLAALEQEAQKLDGTLQQVRGQSRTLSNEVKAMDTEVRRREVEIKRLTVALRQTGLEINNKSTAISILGKKIDASHKSLAASLFLMYAYGDENAVTILLKNKTISDFFHSLHSLARVQNSVQQTLAEFKTDREELQKQKGDLIQTQEDQQNLKALQDVERRFLAIKKKEKDDLLKQTKGKEALFQQLLQSKKSDIAALRAQLFYLGKTGITAEEAVRAATLAASRAKIRPAFLLALLEVETGKQFEDGLISVGSNVGTGTWRRDLYECYIDIGKPNTAEAEKRAFFKITSQLKLDPDRMPVSRRPNYGCGGAMGAAQFLPTTWLAFENQVARLTNHFPPNPWNPEDAFTAAAIFLAQSGASSQTSAGELAAARTYISGSSTCGKSICRYYSNRILALSKEIDRIL